MSSYQPSYGGIPPQTLVSQVRNTAPFFLSETETKLPYLEYFSTPPQNHFEYFRLCLCAHYTTVATFVPTNVDRQIRQKLWKSDRQSKIAMTDLLYESLSWDFRPVTSRGVATQCGNWMSGHHGEWLSVAVGAYASGAKNLLDRIAQEVERQKDIFLTLIEEKNFLGTLKAATIIAHNLGDLDQVQDLWKLPMDDLLRKKTYKLGHARPGPLKTAGDLNKMFMADENHRHLGLRELKCLRKSRDFLLPLGPFFDDWGRTLAKHPMIDQTEIIQVVKTLLDSQERLERTGARTEGYLRAIAGIASVFPGSWRGLSRELASRERKLLLSGTWHQKLLVSEDIFANDWSRKAAEFIRKNPPLPEP